MNKPTTRDAYWFVAPSLLVLLLVLFIPIVATVGLSFFAYPLLRPDLGIQFIGLDNYKQLFADTQFIQSMMRSFVFAGGSVAAELVLGTVMALLLKGKVWGKSFFKVTFMLPMMMVPVVVGVAWRLFLLPDFTPLAQIFEWLHIPFDTSRLLTEPSWAMVSVIVADIWQWTPFVMILLLASLHGIPDEIYEAARVDGASEWRQFWTMTLPLIKPSLITVGILRGMDAIRTFDLVYIMTNGGPAFATELVSIFNYKIAFSRYAMGYASAVSTGVLIILAVVVFAILRYTGRKGMKL